MQLLVRSAIITLVWVVVSEGDLPSLAVGVPAAVLAALFSLALHPGRLPRVHPLGAIRFAAFFLGHSVLGGVDVALRALRPSMPLDPAWIEYPLRIEPVTVRVLLANTLSLLPGTLSAHLAEDTLVIHALDCGGDPVADIARVEQRVADAFGLTLSGRAGGPA